MWASVAADLHRQATGSIASPSPAKLTGHAPSPTELDAIDLPDYGQLSKQAHVRVESISTNGDCPTPNELESSRPPSPAIRQVAGVMPSFFYPYMNRWRVLAACLIYFANGMNDSAPGALIPYVEKWYSVGYAIVSLIWITNAIGYIAAAFATDAVLERLGRAKSLMLSESIMTSAYIIIACSPPFPVVVLAYLVLGFGNAINLALNNVFCANLAHSTVVLGFAHGSYGVGGIVAPILATSLVSAGIPWARFYLIMIGVRLICFVFAGWAFHNFESEGAFRFSNSVQQINSTSPDDTLQPTVSATTTKKVHALSQALKNKITIIGALFIFTYQGAEVSESGWFISYLISYRNGDPAHVGYVTSGFWAGITLGRFVLTPLAHRVGEKRFVYAMGVGVIIFQLIAWFVPNVVGDAVAVAILGLLLGPVYPCAQTIFTRMLDGRVQMTAIGFISSAGSSGGAIVPFLTGLLASRVGTYVLHPVCVACYVVMLACWTGLPRVRKRSE